MHRLSLFLVALAAPCLLAVAPSSVRFHSTVNANALGVVADAGIGGNLGVGGNVTAAGANLSTALPIASGGTGQTSATPALLALLPSTAGNGGLFLTNDGGSGAFWGTVSSGSGSGSGSGYGAYTDRPDAGNAGRQYFATGATSGHWVDTGTTWAPMVGGIIGVDPTLSGAWTAFNSPTSLVSTNGGLVYTGTPSTNASAMRGYQQSKSSTTAYIECEFVSLDAFASGNTTLTPIPQEGCGMRESSTGKSYFLGRFCYEGSAFHVGLVVQPYSSDSATGSGGANYQIPADIGGGPVFLRVRRDTTNIYAEYSRDRNTWVTLQSNALSAVFTSAPDQVILTANGFNSTPTALYRHVSIGG